MRLATFLAALAGLDMITASPIPTSPQPQEGLNARLSWEPPSAYGHKNQRKRKKQWERACQDVMVREGCNAAIMHRGETTVIKPDGEKGVYLKVEGSPFTDMRNAKRMRVFEDGSFADGWTRSDAQSVRTSKLLNLKKEEKPPMDDKPLLLWDPPHAYMSQKTRKLQWEKTCQEALHREGCGMGIIHQGIATANTPDGGEATYINVHAAPGMDFENPRKLRVFEDGSTVEGWSPVDLKHIMEAKRMKKEKQLLRDTQPVEGQTPLLSWSPVDAYPGQQYRRVYWEQKCRLALTKHGCTMGVIHKGETKLKINGQQTSYISVEGAPSKQEMKNSKKMRVFQNGTSTDGWSERDLSIMWHAKYDKDKYKKKKKLRPALPQGQGALVSWDPAHAYLNREKKRKHWEQVCDVALTKAGCRAGIIHKGESKATRPTGEETAYVKVEGAPSLGDEYARKMRVFEDGTYEDGWSGLDLKRIKQAKRPRRFLYRGKDEVKLDPYKFTHKVSWNTADPSGEPYKHLRRLKLTYEKACDKALEREGCDFGIIQQGHRRLRNADGTKSFYANVLAGKNSEPDNARLMRLFEDGSSEWYPEGPLSTKDARRYKVDRKSFLFGKSPSTQATTRGPLRHVSEEPRVSEDLYSQILAPPEVPAQETPTQLPANQASTQASGSEAPSQGVSKRPRIGGSEYQQASR